MVTHPETLDGKPPPVRKRGLWRFIGRHLPGTSIVLMVALLAAVVLYPYVIITVPSGHVGVLWKRFNGIDAYCWCWVGRGTILNPNQLRDEGLHIVWPWDKLFIYNLRLQSNNQTYNAISKDGVSVIAQISIRFQLRHNPIGVLHKFIGPQYMDSVVSPEIGSQAREVISQYSAQEVYTSREEIQEKIRINAQKSLGANLNKLVQPDAMEQPDPKNYNEFLQDSIQVLDTLVLSIELPAAIVGAINRQTEQFYQIQEFKFRVAREAQESTRKQIEANGIAAFQKTVSQGISDSYLRWRGIEATLALAQSTNSKIVVIGNSKDGLPIILGNIDTPASPAPAGSAAIGADQKSPVGSISKPADTTTMSSDHKPSVGNISKPADTTTMGSDHKPSVGNISKPADTTSPAGAPTAPDKNAAASSSAPGSSDKQPKASAPLDLTDIEALISRITERLRGTGSATSSGTGAQPKQ